jgi:hypothetical protein
MEDCTMVMIGKRTIGRGLAVTALFVAGVTATQSPASARDNGAAIGLGVLGGAVAGAAIASTPNPYNNPYYYAPPAPAYYYPPAPAYYPRSCWNAYYQRYYAC